MTRTFTILFTFSLLFFVACKKNSSSGSSLSNALSGKWRPTRSVNVYYSPTNGSFMDSAWQEVGPADYLSFSSSQVISYEDDASSNGVLQDTAAYKVYNDQNFIILNPYGYDTIKVAFSNNNNNVLLTGIHLNTTDGNNQPANEYDTITAVKIN